MLHCLGCHISQAKPVGLWGSGACTSDVQQTARTQGNRAEAGLPARCKSLWAPPAGVVCSQSSRCLLLQEQPPHSLDTQLILTLNICPLWTASPGQKAESHASSPSRYLCIRCKPLLNTLTPVQEEGAAAAGPEAAKHQDAGAGDGRGRPAVLGVQVTPAGAGTRQGRPHGCPLPGAGDLIPVDTCRAAVRYDSDAIVCLNRHFDTYEWGLKGPSQLEQRPFKASRIAALSHEQVPFSGTGRLVSSVDMTV